MLDISIPKLHDSARTWSKTRIVFTIGPATSDVDVICQILENGVSVARINHSHGTADLHHQYAGAVREAAKKFGADVGILVDLAGPKYRTSTIAGGSIDAKVGTQFTLSSSTTPREGVVQVWPSGLHKDVKQGKRVLIDDAVLEATVLEIKGQDILCEATIDGLIASNKTVSIPDCNISLDYLTDETVAGLEFAKQINAEFVGLSCVRSTSDIEIVRKLLVGQGNYNPQLVSKIEMSQVLHDLENVIKASDSVMVARGDLGIEIPLAELPVVQNRIIRLSNLHGKPVITATQMLESMINSVRPTRAEVMDIDAAVQQGTDAMMLSAETAVGKYPVMAVKYMREVALNTESMADYSLRIQERLKHLSTKVGVDDVIAYSAAQITREIDAKAIIAFTESGSTARRISSFKPNVPIIAAVRNSKKAIRQLLLNWGVKSVVVGAQDSIQRMFYLSSQIASTNGYATEGELIVVVMGMPIGIVGNTNLVRVIRVHEPPL